MSMPSTAVKPITNAGTLSSVGGTQVTAPGTKQMSPMPMTPSKIQSEEKRRGHRVLLRIRANVHLNLKGTQETIEVSTLSVNPSGAMLVSPRNLAVQTRFTLEHAGTREMIECRVVSSAKQVPGGFQVPIAFDAPAPHFWKVDFPPDDWKPHDEL